MRTRAAQAVGIAMLMASLAGPATGASPSLSLSRSVGPPTSSVIAHGSGFRSAETVSLHFGSMQVGSAATDAAGAFSDTITVPKAAKPGDHTIRATGGNSHVTATATFTVRTDWTRFRYGQGHIGVQPFENVLALSNVPQLQLAWQAQLGRVVDYASPAVVNGVVYIGSSDGRLWAWPADGCGQDFCTTPLWTSTNVGQIIDAPTVANGKVYVGSQTSGSSNDGKLDVFNAGGCGLPVCPPLWQGQAGPESILQSSPAVVGGRVYVGAYDGKLYVFDASGCGMSLCLPLWTGATGGHIESSPTVSGRTVFIGSNDGKLYAFPAVGCGSATCQPLWTGATGESIFDSTPAVANGTVLIGSAHHLNAFRAAGCGSPTCPRLWRGSRPGDFVNGSPAVFDGHAYIGLEASVGVFNASGCGQADCPPLWLDIGSGTQADVLSSPTIANGVVYVGKMNGQVLAWPAGPCRQFVCREIWSYLTQDPIVSSSPAVVNGKVYIGGSNNMAPEDVAGRLFVFALP